MESYFPPHRITIGLLVIALFWLWGSAPSLHWLDTAELSMVGAVLGIGHPPGQVTHSMFASLWSWLPLGDQSFRTTLGSLCSGVLAASLLFRMLKNDFTWPLWALVISALLSSLVGVSMVRTEVYSLSGLFILLAIHLSHSQDVRKIYLAWFVFGLALVNHTVMALMIVPFLFRKGWKKGILFFLFALGSYAYLYVRALKYPAWDFGHPDGVSKLIWFVRGGLYKAYDEPSLSRSFSNLVEVGGMVFRAMPAVCFLAPFGIWFWKDGRTKVVMALLLGILPLAAMGNFWDTNPDAKGYLLPTLFILILSAGNALRLVIEKLKGSSTVSLLSVFFGLLVLIGATQFQTEVSLRSDWSAHRHAMRLRTEPSSGSFVDTASFSTFSFLRYAQLVEGQRPDVTVSYQGLKETQKLPTKDQAVYREYGISRSETGKYRLRTQDRSGGRMNGYQGDIPQGWYFRPEGPRNSLVFVHKKEVTKQIKSEMAPSAMYGEESLILNYLLYIMWSEREREIETERRLRSDFAGLFPTFNELNLLE